MSSFWCHPRGVCHQNRQEIEGVSGDGWWEDDVSCRKDVLEVCSVVVPGHPAANRPSPLLRVTLSHRTDSEWPGTSRPRGRGRNSVAVSYSTSVSPVPTYRTLPPVPRLTRRGPYERLQDPKFYSTSFTIALKPQVCEDEISGSPPTCESATCTLVLVPTTPVHTQTQGREDQRLDTLNSV